MAPILDDKKLAEHVSVIEKMIQNMETIDHYDEFDELDDSYVLSLWVKEKNIIRPAAELTTFKLLEPGIYTVHFSSDMGLYCQQEKVLTDELFIFTDSKIDSLLDEIELFWNKKDLYNENKLIHKRGILLEGYPGTGKTSLITQLSSKVIKSGGVVFKVTGAHNLNHYVTFIRTGFRKIQPDTPIITILENINQYQDMEEELLDFMDGKNHVNHHIIIATTNNTEEIPDAFLRASRLDLHVEIDVPSIKTRIEYFQHKKVNESLIAELAEKTEGCTLADLKEIYICRFLLDYDLDDAISKVLNPRLKKDYSQRIRKKSRIGFSKK